MSVVAVVVAAGSGTRFGGQVPKPLADLDGRPVVALALESLAAGGCAPAVLNAANEVAVAAFLGGRMRFDQIYQVNEQVLSGMQPQSPDSIDALLALDAEVRSYAEGVIARLPR